MLCMAAHCPAVTSQHAQLPPLCHPVRPLLLQVALLQKENKSINGHLKAAQSARAAAQRAASQLKQENAALAQSQHTAVVRLPPSDGIHTTPGNPVIVSALLFCNRQPMS